LFCIQRWCSE